MTDNGLLNDIDILTTIDPDDLWIYDKFILAKKLFYNCGPAGTTPTPGEYVIRPCVNFRMMSRGATITYVDHESQVPDGYFWCEVFKGRHLSFDYKYGKQILAVEGFRNDPNKLDRFSRWKKVNDVFILPDIIQRVADKYMWLNVEVIGDKVIEVHLRYNDDFSNHDANEIIPIWKEDFYESKGGDRVGFLLVRN